MKLLFAILALLLVADALSDKASTPDETVDAARQEDDAKSFKTKPGFDANRRIPKRPSLVCRPMRRNQVKAILTQKARALRSLGVRLVRVPINIQRRLRRYKKVTLRRRYHRVRPSIEMCQERPGPVVYTLANYANADLAYMTQGVECAESHCNIRLNAGVSLTVNGRCALRTTRVVVPVYNGCRISSKTIIIGCSCKCRVYNPLG